MAMNQVVFLWFKEMIIRKMKQIFWKEFKHLLFLFFLFQTLLSNKVNHDTQNYWGQTNEIVKKNSWHLMMKVKAWSNYFKNAEIFMIAVNFVESLHNIF